MIGELTNHLWQSTVFATVVGLMTIGFRQNRARVRYWMWLSASVKFLLPFSLLMSLGHRLEWAPATHAMRVTPAITLSVMQLSEPFPGPSPLTTHAPSAAGWPAIVIFGLWVCGFVAIAFLRGRGWRRIRAAVRASSPIDLLPGLQVRISPELLEPGVVGLFRPILLLPAGIAERLQPVQLQAVLAHELCHVRRRDNLTSASHMIVEAIFWFHPLVWWIGARLVEERERACDEGVLSLGNEPGDYAEGILNVCRSYVESPLACVAGVTGSNLKKRIQAILTGYVTCELNFTKKLMLAVAATMALALPIGIGIMGASRIHAESQLGVPKFESASIKSCEAFTRNTVQQDLSTGGLHSQCTTLERLIQQAYGLFADGHMNRLSSVTVSGGPAWTRSDFYQINAKAEGPQSRVTMNGPMLQKLLEDRFRLKIHRETREVPVYKMTVAEGGSKLQPFQGSCVPWDWDHPPAHPEPPDVRCETSSATGNGIEMKAVTMTDVCMFFLVTLDRPVVDETGMTGRFNLHLEMPTTDFGRQPRGVLALSNPAVPTTDPSLISAVKTAAQKAGLNLKPAEGPGQFLIIDEVERPLTN